MKITNLALILLSISLSMQALARVEVKAPEQLIGNCIENNGQGDLKVSQYKGETYYNFQCSVTVYTIEEFEKISPINQDYDFYNLGLKYNGDSKKFNGPGAFYGYVGNVYGRNSNKGNYDGTINLWINIVCAPNKGIACNVEQILNAAQQLGNFKETKIELIVVKSIPTPGPDNGATCYPNRCPRPPPPPPPSENCGAACYGGG